MNSDTNKYDTNDDRIIFDDISLLPISADPTYLGEGFAGLCTAGTAVVELFDRSSRIRPGDLVVILPLQFASLRDRSDDFSMRFFKVEREMFLDIMSGVCRITPDFYFYMRKHFCFHITEEQIGQYHNWCDSLNFRVRNKKAEYRRETAIHLLRTFFWDLYVDYLEEPDGQKAYHFTHKEQLIFKFSMLVIEHYKKVREVSFYAEKLCITPKYLTLIASQVTGRSARECISDFVILEMKALLRNANLDIKELVKRLGFRNQSALSRYFRRLTGMSPSEYRDSIHMRQTLPAAEDEDR